LSPVIQGTLNPMVLVYLHFHNWVRRPCYYYRLLEIKSSDLLHWQMFRTKLQELQVHFFFKFELGYTHVMEISDACSPLQVGKKV
jgi:hypothetical protein